MTQPTLQVPETLLDRGAAILSGGVDGLGTPLVTIRNGELEQCEIIALLLHYIRMLSEPARPSPSVAVLTDLTAATKSEIVTLVESLHAVEKPKRGRLAMVYCIKPKSRERSHQLKKLLGLKPSKKTTTTNLPMFKVVLVKELHELYHYIDPGSLTEEYGGTLHYSHEAWLYYHNRVLPVVQASEELILKMPAIKDRMELLQEYDLHDKPSDQLMRLRQEQLQQYQTLLKEIYLEEIIDQCKQVLHLLEQPTDSHLAHVHVSTLDNAQGRLRSAFSQLADDQQGLTYLWLIAERRINITHRIQKCRERANQVHCSIVKRYRQELQDHPVVGQTLSQAELYRTHFTTSLYEPAKDLLTQATETLEEMCRLSEESPEVVSDTSDVTRLLNEAINPFTEDLQRVQDIYVSVHVFHLLFEKTVHWYKKALKFLPQSLKERADPSTPNRLLHTPPEWRQAVVSFLNKHPPPREEHILKLDTDVPPQIDRRVKRDAHAVALRVRFLQRLFRSRRLPTKLVVSAFRWKDELKDMKRQEKPKYSGKTCAQLINARAVKKPIKPKRTKPPRNSYRERRESISSQRSKDFDSSSDNFILREKPSDVSDPNEERFVRLTFTPDDPDHNNKRHFVFPDYGTSAHNPHNYEVSSPQMKDLAESESGIEVVEQEDPYDSIVNKIREVSVSRLPNELKLKYVTDLLSVSLKRADALTRVASQTKVMDISDEETRRKKKKPPRTKSAASRNVSRSMSNLTDPAVYIPRDDSIFSYDDEMAEQKDFENRFKHLKCSFGEGDIGTVLGVLNENRTQDEKIRSAYSMNDLDNTVSEGFMTDTQLRESSLSLNEYPESLLSSLDPEDELAFARHGSQSAEDAGSESTNLYLDMDRFKQSRRNRVLEEHELLEEQERHDDIELEAESLSQDHVEASLRRSEVMLKQEEAARAKSYRPRMSTNQGRLALTKQVSRDLGYDSTYSYPVTPSNGSATSTLQRHRQYRTSDIDTDTLSGPDFY